MATAQAPTAESVRHLERCRTCHTALPLEGPRVCGSCGRAKVTPRHETWPKALKTYLLIRFAQRNLFFGWRSVQESWELLLSGNYAGQKSGGHIIQQSVNADDVYAIAVKDAEEWKNSGAKTEFL